MPRAPGLFLHAEILETFGVFRGTAVAASPVHAEVLALCAGGGSGLCRRPARCPRGVLDGMGRRSRLLEVANYRSGAVPLRDLEQGRPGRLLRLLLGGLLAGAAWELMNFWARTKWIYTVPGFEEWKLLEMPFAGFGGFPPLALSGFAWYAFVSHLRGRSRFLAAAAALAFRVGVRAVLVASAVGRPRARRLSGLAPPPASCALRASGPERLDRAVRREGLAAVASRTGLSTAAIEPAARDAALALHKGMGAPAARLLRAIGIEKVADLVSADARDLTRRLSRAAALRGEKPPRPEYVRVWVRAADTDGRPRR